MVRALFEVIVVDVLGLAGIFFVNQDVGMRIDCTIPGCTNIARTSVGFTYSIFTKALSVTVKNAYWRTVVSPPTLDWIQVLGVALVAINLWYLYRALAGRGQRAPPSAQAVSA